MKFVLATRIALNDVVGLSVSHYFHSTAPNSPQYNVIPSPQVVAALKGIRNIRHLEDSIIEKVVHCAADNAVKARVRVAALEAFRADPCSAKVRVGRL